MAPKEDETPNLSEPLLTTPTRPNDEGSTISSGEEQPDKCRDWPFALLFYAHILIIIVVACALGIPALAQKNDDNSDENDYSDDKQGIFKLTLICACIGILVCFITLGVALVCSRIVIQLSLCWSLILSFILMIWAFTNSNPVVGCICLFYFLLQAVYIACIAKRIPFAAANLSIGLRAVKQNFGVVLLTYFMVFLSFVYTLYWIMALIGAYDDTADCGEDECRDGPDLGLLFLMFLFLFWTQQFLQNSIHVTVAGVVGKWWHSPDEANSCCSKATQKSFMRALLYSSGSIAFGSLFCAIIQALHSLINKLKLQDEGNSCLFCCLNCLLSCMESLINYFNRWAWMYVGIYGYSYCKAAKAVITLFKDRGWTTVINDDLISNAINFLILISALLCGINGQLLTSNEDWFPEKDDVEYVGLFLGFVVGLFVSSITFSVVASSADAVFVLWAEDPQKLRSTHPDMFDRMINAWTKMYPDETPEID